MALALLGRRNRLPVRRRDILDPAHPDGIVDVAELVGIGLGRGDASFEDLQRCSPSWTSMKA